MTKPCKLFLPGALGALIVLAAIALFSSQARLSLPAQAQVSTAEAALVNGGLELPYNDGIANGWALWYTTTPPLFLAKPNVEPNSAIRPGSAGGTSQYLYPQTPSYYNACLSQQITQGITVGHWIRLSAWARVDLNMITPVDKAQTRIGIDPNGGANPLDIPFATYPGYWDTFDANNREWQKLSVGLRATSPTVTVHLCTLPDEQIDVEVYWDDAEFTSSSGEWIFLPVVNKSYCASPSGLWNPDLEKSFGEYTDYQYHDGFSGSVAPYWKPWVAEPRDDRDKHPEYNKTDRDYRKMTGEVAQQFGHSAWGLYRAGIYQVIDCVNPGVTYTFNIYGWGWVGSPENYNDRVSDNTQPDALKMRVGIDPYGGTDWSSSNIVWSPFNPTSPYDAWNLYEVTANSKANKISVWVYAEANEWGMRYHQTFWDNASLTIVSP